MRRLRCCLALFAIFVLLAGAAPPAGATFESDPGVATPTPTQPAALPAPSPISTAAPIPPAPTDPPELRAIWVDAFHDGIKTPAQIDALVAWARAVNMNALFVQVRRRGDVYFLRSMEPRAEDPDLTPGFDPLQYLLDRAHTGPRPLQVHAWVATLPVWHRRDQPPEDPRHVLNQHGLAAGDQTWLMLRDDGAAWAGSSASGSYYLDPGNPEAAAYTAAVIHDLVKHYDVDGIHLDQARYFEGHGYDQRWGYNPASVARFDALHGRDPAAVPEPSDPDWEAWRRDQVTALVRRIYLETKAVKPRVAVSAAVVAWGKGPTDEQGWSATAPYAAVFQDWRQWLSEGIVDYVLPMDYYREVAPQSQWFDRWAGWQLANQGPRSVVIGVGGYLNDPDQTAAQLQRARALRPLGVAVYSYAVPARTEEQATRDAFAAELRALFPHPAAVPALVWQQQPTFGNLAVDVSGVDSARVVLYGSSLRQWVADGTGFTGGLGLTPGDYWLSVTAPGVDPMPVRVTIAAGQTNVIRFAPGVAAS